MGIPRKAFVAGLALLGAALLLLLAEVGGDSLPRPGQPYAPGPIPSGPSVQVPVPATPEGASASPPDSRPDPVFRRTWDSDPPPPGAGPVVHGRVVTTDAPATGILTATVVVNGNPCSTDLFGEFHVRPGPRTEREKDWIHVSKEGFASRFLEFDAAELTETGILIALPPGSPISGSVVDGDGIPVEGARVGILENGTLVEVSYSDYLGRFRLAGAPVGESRIQAWPPRLEGGWQQGDPVTTLGGTTDLVLTLRCEEPREGMVLVTMKDAGTGEVVAPVEWSLHTAGSRDAQAPASRESWYTLAVDEGLLLRNLEPGDWVLWVRGRDGASQRKEFTLDPSRRVMEIPLAAEPGGVVRGRVEIPPQGLEQPLQVRLQGDWPEGRSGGTRITTTGTAGGQRLRADGTFEFLDVVCGPLQVVLQGPGWTGSASIVVASGRTTEVLLPARALGQVRFRNPGPCPVGTLVLSLTSGGSPPSEHRFKLSGSGSFQWETDAAEGRLTWAARLVPLALARSGTAVEQDLGSGEVRVASGEAVEVDLPLR